MSDMKYAHEIINWELYESPFVPCHENDEKVGASC